MEVLLFLVVAVAAYVAADRLLDGLERAAGRRFEYRSFVFFGLFLGLTLAAFALVRALATG